MSKNTTTSTSETKSAKITHSIVMVDPETAARWLRRNKKNRSVRQSAVARYRSDMTDGRWAFTGDPIRFDTADDLLDGQHRLTALSEVEDPTFTVPMLVIRGLPVDSQGVMDQGIKRTPGDQLGLLGYRDGNRVASSVKQFIIWQEGYLFRDRKVTGHVTAPRITEWVQANPSDVEFLYRVGSIVRQNDAPPSIAGAAAISFARIDTEDAVEFFTLLARGAGTAGHPIVTLDKRLQRARREGLKMSDRDFLALFIVAWNAWRDGRQMTKFQRPRGGRWSEDNFPEPR